VRRRGSAQKTIGFSARGGIILLEDEGSDEKRRAGVSEE